jgi:CheY-like chemotaxis protein
MPRPPGATGVGLGLSIVRSLIEAHGGSITVQSDGEGFGSTFTVRLPIISVAAEHGQGVDGGGSTWPKARTGAPMLDGVVVLVVDDDPESREVVAGSLATRRAIVRTAGSAAEAHEILRNHRIDVLLADVGMPDEDGYTLIRKIRGSPGPSATVPAAALTALARDEDREQALNAGFQLHLAKPIDSAALIGSAKATSASETWRGLRYAPPPAAIITNCRPLRSPK